MLRRATFSPCTATFSTGIAVFKVLLAIVAAELSPEPRHLACGQSLSFIEAEVLAAITTVFGRRRLLRLGLAGIGGFRLITAGEGT
jgi:hypothetical protein